MADIATKAIEQVPLLAYRFSVFVFSGGKDPNLIDFRFMKVSGISAKVSSISVEEGGQNLFTHRLPHKVQYENLILERGIPLQSALTQEFRNALEQFQFSPSDVLVSLLDEAGLPVSSWVFIKAYPVSWSLSDFDAQSNSICVETMELAYQRFQSIRL
jgi:phage tail-like protein